MNIVVKNEPNWALKRWLDVRCFSYRSLSEFTGISLDSLDKKINGYRSFIDEDITRIAIAVNMMGDDVLNVFFPKIKKTVENRTCQYFSCPENCRDCRNYYSTVSCLMK